MVSNSEGAAAVADRGILVAGGVSPTRRRDRWIAAGLGLAATVLALAVPFLPVWQNTEVLRWPTAVNGTAPVTDPLVTLRPQQLDAAVSCASVRDLDARSSVPAVLFSTTPPASPDGPTVGMAVSVGHGTVTVDDRGRKLAEALIPPGDCTLRVVSDATRTSVTLGGAALFDRAGDERPQVVGIYSQLDATLDTVRGTSVVVTVDNRFDSVPTLLKTATGALAVLALLLALWALRRVDDSDGRRISRGRRWAWRGRRWHGSDLVRDLAVVAVLAGWLVVGSMTSDDGYILQMIRSSRVSGYVGNYYRWFDVAEAPFGWFYEMYAAWANVSESVLWMRVPAFVMGVLCWLLISRVMLVRLGGVVRRSQAAGWAAAMVFLTFWLPFNNGLRPEPVVVIAATAAYAAVERALATRRLGPIAIAIIAAAFAVAATPTGLIAFAPFLAAAQPLARLLHSRAAMAGWVTVLAPLAGAATIVLVAVFGDQTYATIAEAIRVRTEIGPDLPWFDELSRYTLLFSPTRDGSLARRFPVLLTMLCAIVSAAVLIRRGCIPGAALGPSRRMIGSTLLSFAMLALTPTKWTHHFGAFAALGAGVAALAALASSAAVLRSRRNRSLFLTAVLVVAALAFTGPNTWWYVSDWGVPWFDKPPAVGPISATLLLLLAAAATLIIATVEHLRGLEASRLEYIGLGSRTAGRSRWRTQVMGLGMAPLAMICGLLVLFEIASLVKGVQKQTASYSLAATAVTDPTGCALTSKLMVETDPTAGLLPAAGPVRQPQDSPRSDGFSTGALPATGPGSVRDDDGHGGDDPSVRIPDARVGTVLSSYRPGTGATGDLRTGWYVLPSSVLRGEAPLVLGIGGQLGNGNSVTVEFARATPGGATPTGSIGVDGVTDTVSATADPSGTSTSPPTGSWRDVRLDLTAQAVQGPDRVRVIATDRALSEDGWIAVTPPRVPKLTPLLDVVRGSRGYLDWPIPFVHPCLSSFEIARGVADVPRYRVLADPQQRQVGDDWSSAPTAGPLSWIPLVARQRVVPTYLVGDWGRDWGQLRLTEPYQPNAGHPDEIRGDTQVWGWQNAGPIGDPPTGRASTTR